MLLVLQERMEQEMKKSFAVLDKPVVQPLTLTITLSPEDAEFLKEHAFWTADSPEACVKRLLAEYRQPDGDGETLWWDIARDAKKRAAAFKRNNLSASEIKSWNKSLDETFDNIRRESDRANVKLLKKMSTEQAKAFLRNTPSVQAKRLLLQSGHDPSCLNRSKAKESPKAFADIITLTDEIRARALGVKLTGGEFFQGQNQ
jgi:arsenate reductase-like glutaredoxin family protein